MKRTFLYLVVVLCFALPFLKAPAQDMSHEEEVVRNAYAKFSLLCSLPPVTEAAIPQLAGVKVDTIRLQARIANATPVFNLSNFQVGAIVTIANEPWGDFVTAPSQPGEILVGQVDSQSYSDNGNQTSWQMINVRWKPSPQITPEVESKILSRTVATIIKIASPQWQPASMPPVTYTRYAEFTVDVTFQGQSSGPHKAIFFFGKDAKGKEYLAPNDIISGPSPLDFVANNPTEMEPTGLLLGAIREAPVMASWIRANVISEFTCSETTQALCCSKGHCGLAPTVFNRDLSTQLPAPKN
jgi:hypothetical protein